MQIVETELRWDWTKLQSILTISFSHVYDIKPFMIYGVYQMDYKAVMSHKLWLITYDSVTRPLSQPFPNSKGSIPYMVYVVSFYIVQAGLRQFYSDKILELNFPGESFKVILLTFCMKYMFDNILYILCLSSSISD